MSEAQLTEITSFPGQLGRVQAALRRLDQGIPCCFTDEQLKLGVIVHNWID